MTKLLLTLLAAGFLAGCLEQSTATSDTLPWEEAVALLNTGGVISAAQAHDLTVTLHLVDGNSVVTTEPHIDAIFDEVTRCGTPCADISLLSE